MKSHGLSMAIADRYLFVLYSNMRGLFLINAGQERTLGGWLFPNVFGNKRFLFEHTNYHYFRNGELPSNYDLCRIGSSWMELHRGEDLYLYEGRYIEGLYELYHSHLPAILKKIDQVSAGILIQPSPSECK